MEIVYEKHLNITASLSRSGVDIVGDKYRWDVLLRGRTMSLFVELFRDDYGSSQEHWCAQCLGLGLAVYSRDYDHARQLLVRRIDHYLRSKNKI